MSATSSPYGQQPIHWVLDWDGTITRHDTLDALVGIATSVKSLGSIEHHWKRVTQAYLDDHTKSVAKLVPGGKWPTTIAEEKNLLLQLKAVEQRSLDRVSESGIFADLTGTQITEGATQAIAAERVQLRAGFGAFFSLIKSREITHNDKFSILSVNWSRRFIAASLRASGINIQSTAILSNELGGIDDGHPSDGRISALKDNTVIGSADKLREFERLRREHEVTGYPAFMVYIGDSWTDVECILAADLGICIRDEPMGNSQKKIAEAFERLGVSCPHIASFDDTEKKSVVWAEDFEQIGVWMEKKSQGNPV